MSSKSEFRMKIAEKLVDKSSEFGVRLVICGGIAVHILSNYMKRDSPRPWNHKDIDFIVPLSHFSRAIAYFKTLGFTRVFVAHKKARLTENHVRFGKNVNDVKILVDVYGKAKISIIRIKQNDREISLLSPRIELENWKDRERRLGPKPSIRLSIDFLEDAIKTGSFEEEEIK